MEQKKELDSVFLSKAYIYNLLSNTGYPLLSFVMVKVRACEKIILHIVDLTLMINP